MAAGLTNAQSSSVSPRSWSRNAAVRSAPSFHWAGRPDWSTRRLPGATSRLPAPPTASRRLTPERLAASMMDRAPVPRSSVPGLNALTAMSCPATSEASSAGLVASPFAALGCGCAGSLSGLRTIAMTSCPRSRLSDNSLLPTKPVAPKGDLHDAFSWAGWAVRGTVSIRGTCSASARPLSPSAASAAATEARWTSSCARAV